MIAKWKWLSTAPCNGILAAFELPEQCVKASASFEIPIAIRCVVLTMELALVSGGAFLLLLFSSVVGALARSLVDNNVFADVCETSTFGWGLVMIMAIFLQLPPRVMVRKLKVFGCSGVITCVESVLLHAGVVVAINLWSHNQVLISWRNVDIAVHRPDGTFAVANIVQNLLLVPLKEELFFRGVIVLVAINRLQNIKWSVSISSLLFAAIHVVNAKGIGTQYSAAYVAFQVFWAGLVGLFLALKLVVSGSLFQCVVLHISNNIFALGVSKTIAIAESSYLISVSAALTTYSLAIARQLQLLYLEVGHTHRCA
ncbi:hypothetical protein CCR75_003015 [Bremia lactucae]|uniref:CAAX prenyl protease 2/Lysostaphin resistance protein A-like domain-containing protein n=1 Tax=Bremia lactucae TaxID=4779 RepID=A0A976FFF5_BRELC|nr:hypothetical protein CCR75_003015 [Bremia lactucae]